VVCIVKERITISILDKTIQLYNKQIVEITTTYFPLMTYKENVTVLIKDRIFREDIDGAVVYYIFDRDNYKIIIIRDDEKSVEDIIKKTRGAIIVEIMNQFNIKKVTVKEHSDGLHIIENDIVVGDRGKPYTIKPRLLPPVIVYYAEEKGEGGIVNKEVTVSWKILMSVIIFAVKLYLTKDVVEKAKMLYESGKGIDEVAKDLGMTYSQVHYLLVKSGVKFRRQRLPEHVKEKIKELAEQGVPAYKIAKELSLNEGTVLKTLRKQGLVKTKRKLTQEEINMIIQLYKEGKSIYEIAKRLGRSTNLVFHYLKKLGLKS